MNKRRFTALAMSLVLAFTGLAACNTDADDNTDEDKEPVEDSQEPEDQDEAEEPEEDDTEAAGEGSVYYVNFKPEADDQWQELAEVYTEETGVPVRVLTSASGNYETTLKSEMAKTDAPTLFQVNGPVGLASWKDYCLDLSDAEILTHLTNEDFTLKDGDETLGVAYVVESYGLIYNKPLLEKAGYTKDDIKNFDDLKAVAEDITARKDELGFAAFTSAGMDASSDWRFTTHLANYPIFYEYKERGIDNTDAIEGLYLDEYRQIWDLYINNSTVEPGLLSSLTAEDANAEFKTGEGVFYQNGTWAYADIAEVGDENLGLLPIYIGAEGEEKYGVATGTENYWCVNKNASEEDIQATLDFMNWCVTSKIGTKAMCGTEGAMPSGNQGMGFVIPYEGNRESENPLVNIANEYTEEGYEPVTWNFSTIPSEQWKDNVGSALTTYAADQSDENWAKVEEAFVDGWATEAAAVSE